MKISRSPLLVIPALLLISTVGSAQLTPLEFCEEYRCESPEVNVNYTLFDKYVCWNGSALTLKQTTCPTSSVEYHLDLGEQDPASGNIYPLDITAGPQGNEFFCCSGESTCAVSMVCSAGEVLVYCFTDEVPVKVNGYWICQEA